MGRNIISRNGAPPPGANLLGGSSSGRNIIGRNGSPSHGGGSAPSGGGGHGDFLSGLEHAAHFVAQKSELAAHDIKSIPGGLVQASKALVVPVAKVDYALLTGGNANKQVKKGVKTSNAYLAGVAHGTAQSVEHPLRDPFLTATTLFPLTKGIGGVVARGAEVSDALRAGEGAGAVAKASLKRPPVRPRLIEYNGHQVPLHASTNEGYRGAQFVYDKAIQKALDSNPSGRISGKANDVVKGHALRRIGGAVAETNRYQNRMAAVPADLLDHYAAKLGKLPTGDRAVRRAALNLTSEQVTPQEAVAYHEAQAAKGVNPAMNRKVAKLYQRVADSGLVHLDERGGVVVNAADHPALAKADAQLAVVQHGGDQILASHGIMSPEELASRRNAPGRIVNGGKFDKETQSIVGGEGARPGRGFVTNKAVVAKTPRSEIAATRGPVTGDVRKPISAQRYTGGAKAQGIVPANPARSVAGHYRNLLRFANTTRLRNEIAKMGNPVRQGEHDILIRVPGAKAGKISDELNVMLGRREQLAHTEASLNLADAPDVLSSKFEDYKNHLLPDLQNKFANDSAQAIGTKAPKGFKWVDRRVLGPLTENVLPRGKVAKVGDALNSDITSATVYLKPGHALTRLLTNASTNIVQGSWKTIGRSKAYWDALTPRDRLRALAAAGQHSFQAMPHEGTGRQAAIARAGSNAWAHYADSAFRFNSLVYEAHKAGLADTPADFSAFLDKLENSHNLSAAEAAKVDWVAKHANRAGIAYDRLSPTEKRYLARYVWFYPWVKGSAMFAGHTLVEHPIKGAVLANAGASGRQTQQRELGELPSYEQGLFQVGKGGPSPLVADFNTFVPTSGATSAMDILARPGTASGNLNPVYQTLGQLLYGLTPYGSKSKSPLLDAAKSLVAATPESQVVTGAVAPSNGMFQHNAQSALLRALLGPGVPRRINVAKAHSAAAREKSGR